MIGKRNLRKLKAPGASPCVGAANGDDVARVPAASVAVTWKR